MSYSDCTYVIFDGDNDKWAFAHMKGWNALENVNFNFNNAHDIGSMTANASNEEYVKRHLRERFKSSSQIVLLVGEKTKNLYRYVRWELEVAQSLDLPIIVVNLNGLRQQDSNLCPPIVRNTYAVHIPFRMRIIKYALGQFPQEYKNRTSGATGPRSYNDSVYQKLGLND